MPTTSTTAVVTAATLLVAGSLAASQASLDVSGTLEEQVKALMENTLRDLEVGWLDTLDASGHVEDRELHSIELLVRLDATTRDLALDELVILTGDGAAVELVNTSALRDEDGSMEANRLTPGDLVRLELVPEEPLDPRGTVELTFYDPDRAPLRVVLGPAPTGSGHVSLDVWRSW